MKSKMAVIVMAITLVFGTYAFAGKGMGHGQGKGMMQKKGCGCPAVQNLTAEEQQKVAAERDAFLKDTETLREQLGQKHQELMTEMTKTDANQEKAAGIMKEISDLKAQLAQKRLAHQFKVKQINPTLGTCFLDRPGSGMGMKGMGMGPCQGAACGKGMGRGMNPNCPYSNQTDDDPDTTL